VTYTFSQQYVNKVSHCEMNERHSALSTTPHHTTLKVAQCHYRRAAGATEVRYYCTDHCTSTAEDTHNGLNLR